jgi:hypothetical protein
VKAESEKHSRPGACRSEHLTDQLVDVVNAKFVRGFPPGQRVERRLLGDVDYRLHSLLDNQVGVSDILEALQRIYRIVEFSERRIVEGRFEFCRE